MKKVNALNHFAVFIFVFTILNTFSAFAGPSRTTYQAKIVKPDGYPLETSSVNFKFTILDPSATCILYSESYSSVNMASTGGLISFSLGSGIKSFPVSSTTFEQIFSNITPNMGCDTGGGPPAVYTPLANDSRKIVMQFNDGNGWQTLPAMTINAVPYAMYANDTLKFNGLGVSDFVQLSSVPTCAASEALRYNGSMFSCIAAGGTGTVTSSTVITALGYTPADGASVTTVSNYASSVSSTVFSVSSTVSSLASTVSDLQSSVGVSFAAITSSQWNTSGTTINYAAGNVGVGTTMPVTKLDVSGGLRIGTENATCAASYAGTIRYNAGNVEYCNGAVWSAFGVSGAGLQTFNGSTSGTQSFANGTAGTAPNFVTANGVHTLNIPYASAGSTTAGLISNTDYQNFSNKITSSAASIAQVLGYTPANSATVSTLQSSLGSLAYLSSLDLGSVNASGTLAVARLPSFVGDVTSTAASNTLVLSNTGVTVGTYTKVTVDAKGRVTSGTLLSNSDVTTALGYTPANSATIVSSQWATSGSAIYYNAGNVGIGTTAPSAKLHLAAGTSSIAALKLTSGTLLTSPQSGTVEYDGNNLYFTDGTNTRRTLAATTGAGTYDNASLISNSSGNIVMYPNGGTGSVTVSATTASTNSSTGALVVKGGLGVAGTANIGGSLNVSGSSVIDGSLKLSAMTSGSILFAGTSGVVSQDNSNFYWDNANKRLGLGINAPVSQFQMNNVTSGISVGMSLTNTDAAKDSFIRLYTKYTNTTENMGSGNPSAGNKGWNIKGVGDSGASNANNLSYEFWNGTSWITPMALTSSGKVGVGTNSPLGLLQVGSGYVQAAVPFAVMAGTPGIPATSGTTQTNGSLRLGTNTSNSSVFDMGLYNAAPFGAWLQAQNGGDFSDHTLYPIALQPNGGNVGIGMANPGYKLDVSGVVRANSGGEWSIRTAFDSSTATNRNHFAALKSRAGGAVQSGDNLGGLAMGGKYDSTNYAYGWNGGAEISAFASENWSATNRGADIAFLTVPNSSTAIAERMRITNAGNVGIGTSNPSYKLDINDGNARISTTNSTYTALMIANTVSGHSLTYYDAINGDFVGGDYGYVGQNNSGFMEYNIGSASPMPYHVFSGGNVGVGTTQPLSKLSVTDSLAITNSAGIQHLLMGNQDSAGVNHPSIIRAANGNVEIGTGTSWSGTGGTFTSKFWLGDNGNVGIGTASPQAKLEVAGDIQSNETYYTTKIFADGWAIGDYAEVVQASPSGAAGSSALLEVSIAGTRGNWVESSTYHLVSAHAESDVWRELTPVSVNYYTTFSYRCFTVDANGYTNVIKFRIRAIRNSTDCSAASSGQFPIVFKAHSSGHNGGWTALTATGTGATVTGFRTTVGSEWNLYTGASRNAAIHTITAKEGYVGIGVSSPLQMLHVTNGAASNGDQTIAQIGSGAGSLFFTHNQPGIGSNSKYKSGWKYEDAGYASLIHFYTASGRMSFQTAPSGTAGAAATFTERMVILNDSGNVGIGLTAPTYQLQLSTDSAAKPGTSTWTIASDMRLKNSRAPFTRGINELLGLNTIYFTYKKDNPLGLPSDKEYVGIRAQDAQKVIPEAVTVDEKGFLHVTNDAIIWTVVNAVKELYHKWFADSLAVHRELASVKAENAELKKENAEIKMRLEKIEKALAEPEKKH